MWSLLFSPGSWYAQGFICAFQESVFQFCVSSGSSMVGLMVTSSKRAYATPRSAAPRPPDLQQATSDLYLPRRHSNPQRLVWLSLWGVSQMCRRFCLSPLSVSGGYGFHSKHDFAPPTILLGLLLCPLEWAIFFFFLVGSNILLLMLVQQRVVILEFSQEKMSVHPSTPPSCINQDER